jgi:prepilin-type N-terminal cleavage/methylation domain-containing protein
MVKDAPRATNLPLAGGRLSEGMLAGGALSGGAFSGGGAFFGGDVFSGGAAFSGGGASFAKKTPLPFLKARDNAGDRARDNHGFTLVELIVAISISLIILSVTMTILISSMNISSQSIKASQGEQVANACLDFVLDQLSFATTLESSSSTTLGLMVASDAEFLYIGDTSGNPSDRGRLYLRTAQTGGKDTAPLDTYGEQFYLGGTISLRVTYTRTLNQRSAVTAIVTLYDAQGGEVAHKQRSMMLINGPVDTNEGNWPFGEKTTNTITFAANDIIKIVPLGSGS